MKKATGILTTTGALYVNIQSSGGAHVKRTGEVGAVTVRKVEKQGRMNPSVKVELGSVDLGVPHSPSGKLLQQELELTPTQVECEKFLMASRNSPTEKHVVFLFLTEPGSDNFKLQPRGL